MSIYFKIVGGLLAISAILLGSIATAHADSATDLAAADAIVDTDMESDAKIFGIQYRNRRADQSTKRLPAYREKIAITAAANHSASETDWTNTVMSVVETSDGLYDDTTVTPVPATN